MGNSCCNFLNIDPATLPDQPFFSIISAPLEKTVTWKHGTAEGPEAIINASQALEELDDQLLEETWKKGIITRPSLDFSNHSIEKCMDIIKKEVESVLANGQFPITLGGEHSIAVACIDACHKKFPDLQVLQLDAHADLRSEYEFSRYSHACVMRRIMDKKIPFTQVGVRSFSTEELDFFKNNACYPWTMEKIRQTPDWINEIIREIKSPLYITLDVDVLDPSIMPATGTPEPDGFLWDQINNFLKQIITHHSVVGMDIVELAPIYSMHHADFTVAKLVYRVMGLISRQASAIF